MQGKIKKKYAIDMCNGPIFSKMLLFTVPLMLSSILQLLFNAADIIVVGRYAGDDALAAVGSNTALINLLTNFFMGLSIGANVLAARYFGAKEKKEMSETVQTAMVISVISGVILTIVGFFGAHQILTWMQTPEKVLPLSTIYLKLYFLGMPATMVYNFGSSILRAIGDTKRPLYYLFVAGVINVCLNLLFVIKFKMGVSGVAIATVLSQCVSAFMIIKCMICDDNIKFTFKDFRIYKDKFIKIIRVGLPASFQGIIFSISNVIIQSSVNSFGEIVVAGNSAAMNIEGFVYVAMNAFHQGTISFTSQNYGAGRDERINKILISGELGVCFVGIVFGNFAALFGKTFLSLYTVNAVVIEAGMRRLNVICVTYALCGIMDVLVGSIRGLGYSIMPTIVSLIGACGLRLIWIFTFFRLENFHTLESLYFTYPVSWIVTSVAHLICFVMIRRRMHIKKNATISG